ncbi:MAG: hypothetical protein JSV88_13635, partial [Candidatus Aminicenantes bacterium]
EIRESEEEFKEISGEYNKKITDLKNILESNKSRLAEVTKKKLALRGNILTNLLDIYDTLANKKNGKAVSLVESEFCGICNVKIRPQRLNELISSKQMFTCDSCGRILFYRKVEKPEAKAKEKEKEKENKNKNP